MPSNVLDLYSVKIIDPQENDERRITKFYRKGHVFSFDKHVPKWKLTNNIYMDVTQKYHKGKWETKSYHTDTARPAPSRAKLWLMYPVVPTSLPVAKVIK